MDPIRGDISAIKLVVDLTHVGDRARSEVRPIALRVASEEIVFRGELVIHASVDLIRVPFERLTVDVVSERVTGIVGRGVERQRL